MNQNHKLNNPENKNENNQQKQPLHKRVWNKIPGWGKKALIGAGLLGAGFGAYALGRGRAEGDVIFEFPPEGGETEE